MHPGACLVSQCCRFEHFPLCFGKFAKTKGSSKKEILQLDSFFVCGMFCLHHVFWVWVVLANFIESNLICGPAGRQSKVDLDPHAVPRLGNNFVLILNEEAGSTAGAFATAGCSFHSCAFGCRPHVALSLVRSPNLSIDVLLSVEKNANTEHVTVIS